MAFFGGGGGGAFGAGSSRPPFQIIGIDANLLTLNYSALAFQRSVGSLPPSEALSRINEAPAAIPPWEIAEESQSLVSRINEVRALTSFIDTSRSYLSDVAGDLDKEASFTIFKALDNLRVLAQYAAEKTTPESSLIRLDQQFRSGFGELQDYMSTTELDKLELFFGDKINRAETDVRLGKNSTAFVGKVIQTGSLDDAISGMTGTEVFDITLTKNGVSDTITVDLSEIAGTVSINSFNALVNSKIEAVPLLDENGDPKLDGEGAVIAKYLTRLGYEANDAFDFALKIEGVLTEEIVLTPQNVQPGLVVTGELSRVDGTGETRSFIQDIGGLDATLTQGERTEFAGIDLAQTALQTEIAAQASDDDELDPKIAALKAEMLAKAAGTDGADAEEAVDEDIGSISNLDGKSVVAKDTESNGVVVDSAGNIYVVGQSAGSFDSQINTASESDVFLSKFDSEGNVVYSRLLGSSGEASGFDITLDSNDNVIIAGQTDNSLASGDVIRGKDAFVAKFTSAGDELFRYQLDGFSTSSGLAVSVDGNDNILLAGETFGAISSTSSYSGGGDGLILQIDGSSGSLLQSSVFGDAGGEAVKGVAVAADGNILLAVEDGDNVVLKKLDAADFSNEIFSTDLGSIGPGGSIEAVKVEGNQIYIVGVSNDASYSAGGLNGSYSGGQDGFVTGLTDNGGSSSADFTTYIGTAGTDSIADATISGGKIFIAGSTASTLDGEASAGAADGFVARIDAATGAVEDTQQFGAAFNRMDVSGVAFAETGSSFLSTLGLPAGAINADQSRDITTQTSVKDGDYFYIKFGDSLSRTKITIDDGDTFKDLARQIRIASGGKIEATMSTTKDGQKLKLQAIDGQGSVDLIAGSDGRDALARLGIAPTRLLPTDELFGLGEDNKSRPGGGDGGAFGLGLDPFLLISDKTSAKYVLGILDTAIQTIQRAYRSTTFDPIKALLAEQSKDFGPAPARITAQIAQYQNALARLQGASFGGGGGFSV